MPVRSFVIHLVDDILYLQEKKFQPPENVGLVREDEHGWHLVLSDKQGQAIVYENINRYMQRFKKMKFMRRLINVIIKSLK